jgi:hypothetical protein
MCFIELPIYKPLKILFMKKCYKVLYTLMFVGISTWCQPAFARLPKEHYLQIGVHNNRSALRDWATSPLWYKGSPISIGLAYEAMNAKRDIETGVVYRFGNYKATDAEPVSMSKVKSGNLFHSRMYTISKLSKSKLHIELGGMAQIFGNFRMNLGLQNNAVGIEAITSVLGSARIGYHWERTQEERKKLGFIKLNMHPAQRSIRLRANVGLLNFPLRNGYIYSSHSGVLNSANPFMGYTFSAGGTNLSTALEYTIQRPGRNGYRFSYVWEAYQTAKKFDHLDMVTNSFRFTLLFNTNRVSTYAK